MKTINLLISIAFVSLFFVMISSCKKEVVTECPSIITLEFDCNTDTVEVFKLAAHPATPILSEEEYLNKLNDSVEIPANSFTIDLTFIIYKNGEVCISEIFSFQNLPNPNNLKSVLEEDNWNYAITGGIGQAVVYTKPIKISCSNGLFESVNF